MLYVLSKPQIGQQPPRRPRHRLARRRLGLPEAVPRRGRSRWSQRSRQRGEKGPTATVPAQPASPERRQLQDLRPYHLWAKIETSAGEDENLVMWDDRGTLHLCSRRLLLPSEDNCRIPWSPAGASATFQKIISKKTSRRLFSIVGVRIGVHKVQK